MVIGVGAAAWGAGMLGCDCDYRYGGAGLGWLCWGLFYTGFCCASPSGVVVRSEGVWLLAPSLVNDGRSEVVRMWTGGGRGCFSVLLRFM